MDNIVFDISKISFIHYSLNSVLFTVIRNYDVVLLSLLSDEEQLRSFAVSTPVVDMVRYAPMRLSAEQLLSILRPLTPRFYSISSSQAEVKEEVHITVSMVSYKIENRLRTGGASSYLIQRLTEDDEVRIFVKRNDNFRLPMDLSIPVIMICAGTGIAPFRSFMQQRALSGTSGPNWLFFGNQSFIDDFLYQVEWQGYVKDGILTHIDTVWSRDDNKKKYIQDKLLEKGFEVWNWIMQGAYIYVCGDADHMASGVEQALIKLLVEYGSMNFIQADEFLSNMRIERRYQRDIY